MTINTIIITFSISFLFINGCSTIKETNRFHDKKHTNNIAHQKIFNELSSILKEGVLMDKKKLRNNSNFCINRATQLQSKALNLKKLSEAKSFINLAISANHLELCTSCDVPTAKDHCEWAADSLNQLKVIYGPK